MKILNDLLNWNNSLFSKIAISSAIIIPIGVYIWIIKKIDSDQI